MTYKKSTVLLFFIHPPKRHKIPTLKLSMILLLEEKETFFYRQIGKIIPLKAKKSRKSMDTFSCSKWRDIVFFYPLILLI